MGCKLDLEVVKEVLKKPVAPDIVFASQFIIMPLVSTSKSFKEKKVISYVKMY